VNSIPDEFDFLILPNRSGQIRPWAYSASNINKYQKQKNINVSGE
jgi:hypothetical protein